MPQIIYQPVYRYRLEYPVKRSEIVTRHGSTDLFASTTKCVFTTERISLENQTINYSSYSYPILTLRLQLTHRPSGRCVSEGPGRQLARESGPFHASQVLLLGKASRQEKVRNRRCLDRAIQFPSRCRLVHRKWGLHDGRLQQLCPRAILVKLPRIGEGKSVYERGK